MNWTPEQYANYLAKNRAKDSRNRAYSCNEKQQDAMPRHAHNESEASSNFEEDLMTLTINRFPRTSLQIDSNFGWLSGIDPWPRYFKHQEALLNSTRLAEEDKAKLRSWIYGKHVDECIPIFARSELQKEIIE